MCGRYPHLGSRYLPVGLKTCKASGYHLSASEEDAIHLSHTSIAARALGKKMFFPLLKYHTTISLVLLYLSSPCWGPSCRYEVLCIVKWVPKPFHFYIVFSIIEDTIPKWKATTWCKYDHEWNVGAVLHTFDGCDQSGREKGTEEVRKGQRMTSRSFSQSVVERISVTLPWKG